MTFCRQRRGHLLVFFTCRWLQDHRKAVPVQSCCAMLEEGIFTWHGPGSSASVSVPSLLMWGMQGKVGLQSKFTSPAKHQKTRYSNGSCQLRRDTKTSQASSPLPPSKWFKEVVKHMKILLINHYIWKLED